MTLGQLLSIRNQWMKKHIIDIRRQEIYYRDKKGKLFGHKWHSSVPANFMDLIYKL